MELGMPALLELDIASCARLCRELGLSFVELNGNLPAYQPDELEPGELAALARREEIVFTYHLDENLNPADFNAGVAEAWTRTALQAIGLARRAGMPVVTMHLTPGVYFTLPGGKRYLFDRYRDRYLAAMERFRDRCAAAIGRGGPLLCVENTAWSSLPFLCEAVELLLDSPAFGLTYDWGHAALAGDDPLLRQRLDRVGHMHAHDVRDGRDHLPLGAGTLDIPARFSLAEEIGCRVVLEQKTQEALRASCVWVRKNGEMQSISPL